MYRVGGGMGWVLLVRFWGYQVGPVHWTFGAGIGLSFRRLVGTRQAATGEMLVRSSWAGGLVRYRGHELAPILDLATACVGRALLCEHTGFHVLQGW
jgi:hypothetical protein